MGAGVRGEGLMKKGGGDGVKSLIRHSQIMKIQAETLYIVDRVTCYLFYKKKH